MNDVCRKCGSGNISYYKAIHKGKKVTSFHFGIKCKSCGKKYNVPRSKHIFEIVKDQKWEYSKNAAKILFTS